MAGGQHHPIQVLVNYWEIQPGALASRLDEFLQNGISHLVTFLPWQAFEADISHAFSRFLQAACDRRMTVSLIVTPEVGIHYANSGLPKDVMSRAENAAQHFQKGPIVGALPPTQFALPSLLAPEFTKRYFSYLSRIDTLLADFEKTSGRSLENVTLVLTGSFWKYYRSPASCMRGAFSLAAGDYSPGASVNYRQRVDEFYGQAEFNDPSPMASSRWKTQMLEDVNRRWFYQQCEAIFRNRTLQFVRKRARTVQVQEIELFTPEADPSLSYLNFLQTVSGRSTDFHRLSSILDETASFGSMAGMSRASSWVHWSSLGGFRNLTDSERQYLMLKSLLLIGGQGGSLLIDEEEWLAFSRGFRHRVESFARLVSQGDLKLLNRALYLVPHLWSGPGALWRDFSRRAGHGARKIASMDWAMADREATLMVIDPSCVMTKEAIHRLMQWVSSSPSPGTGGRVLALPRTTLYTEAARAQLELVAAGSRRIEMNLGVSYRIHEIGDGKLVVYDVPDGVNYAQELAGGEGELRSPTHSKEWQTFMSSLFSLADVREECLVSDARLSFIPLERRDRTTGLFVMNGSMRPVSADILFPSSVSVSDLAVEVSASAPTFTEQSRDAAVVPARRFSLDVPPCGILPLAVERVGACDSAKEEVAADQLAGLGRENVMSAASAELPGLDLSDAQETVWN